jgi:hypothetical protein
MKIYLVREGDRFKPLSEDDFEKTKRVKEGKIIEVEYKMPRNPLFHNKFMSMVRKVFENQEEFDNIERLLDKIKIDLGYYDSYHLGKMEVVVPSSISFAKMDEIEFNALYDKAVTMLLSRYLPTVSRAELERYISEIARYAG